MKSFFDFDQFLILAEIILHENNLKHEDINMECIYRTVLNRAYYACFNHTKEWLDVKFNLKTRVFDNNAKKMRNKRNLSEHVIVYEDLRLVGKLAGNPELFKILFSNLKVMFENRIVADYKINDYISLEDVNESLKNANGLIEVLSW